MITVAALLLLGSPVLLLVAAVSVYARRSRRTVRR